MLQSEAARARLDLHVSGCGGGRTHGGLRPLIYQPANVVVSDTSAGARTRHTVQLDSVFLRDAPRERGDLSAARTAIGSDRGAHIGRWVRDTSGTRRAVFLSRNDAASWRGGFAGRRENPEDFEYRNRRVNLCNDLRQDSAGRGGHFDVRLFSFEFAKWVALLNLVALA